MLVYSLCADNIKGEKFREFISYCLEQSTYFSLTLHDCNEDIKNNALAEIDKYSYKSIQTYSWYCYKTFEKPLSISLYYSTKELVDWFVNFFNSLFEFESQGIEDICFFRNKNLLFGSVSHEKIAQLFLSSEKEILKYETYSRWEKISIHQDKEYIPDLEIYLT